MVAGEEVRRRGHVLQPRDVDAQKPPGSASMKQRRRGRRILPSNGTGLLFPFGQARQGVLVAELDEAVDRPRTGRSRICRSAGAGRGRPPARHGAHRDRPARRLHEDAQPPAEEHVHGVAGCALPEEQLATAQRDVLAGCGQAGQRAPVRLRRFRRLGPPLRYPREIESRQYAAAAPAHWQRVSQRRRRAAGRRRGAPSSTRACACVSSAVAADQALLSGLAGRHPALRVRIVPAGDHHLPLLAPEPCLRAIRDALTEVQHDRHL